MILLRTYDENGNIQFLPVTPDMFYQECKHCGRIFPISSICTFLKTLREEVFELDVLDWCEECLIENCEWEEHYRDTLAVIKEPVDPLFEVREILVERAREVFSWKLGG